MQTDERYVPTWTLGDKLRRIRRDVHMSQSEFAAVLGVGDKRYGAWESDTNAPPATVLLNVAKRIELRFGRDAGLWLLGMDAEPAPQPDPDPPGREEVEDRMARLAARKRSTRPYVGPRDFAGSVLQAA